MKRPSRFFFLLFPLSLNAQDAVVQADLNAVFITIRSLGVHYKLMIRFANVDVWGPVTGGAQRFIPARRPPEGPCIAIKHIVNFTQRLPSFQSHDKPPQSRMLLLLVGVSRFFVLFYTHRI